MNTFARRQKIRTEHSGIGEATPRLRHRVLSLINDFSGDETRFGVMNTDWIHLRALSRDITQLFGRNIDLAAFADSSQFDYADFFTLVELATRRARKDLSGRKQAFLTDLTQAFELSGSAYLINLDGLVELRVDEETATAISQTVGVLEPLPEAQVMFKQLAGGIIQRVSPPRDVVRDMSLVIEKYLKSVTGKDNLDEALRDIQQASSLHPIQLEILKKLRAYRGDARDVTHDSNSPAPDEADALWYVESAMSIIKRIETKKRHEDS